MTTVVLFHSVLGVRRGERDAAERLRAAGHEVRVPDLWPGRVFDAHEPATAFADQLGPVRVERALADDPTLPDEHDPVATELLWSRVLPFVRDHA